MPIARQPFEAETGECLEICQRLHAACLHTVHASLKRGGPYASARHVNLLLDCAAVTQAMGDMLLRHSELHAVAADACATVCLACAKTCGHAADDELAALCHRCAGACRQILTAAE